MKEKKNTKNTKKKQEELNKKQEENNRKRVYALLAVLILIIILTGISYAVFQFTGKSDANTIKTGIITMSYSEAENGIFLDNALPLSDTTGKALSGNREYFDFTVSTGTSRTLNIPYEINVTPGTVTVDDTHGALKNDQVKVYLSDQAENQIVAPKLISTLEASTLRTGSLVLYKKTNNPADARQVVDNYRLRIWIDGDIDVTSIQGKSYSYSLKVNVNALVNAES